MLQNLTSIQTYPLCKQYLKTQKNADNPLLESATISTQQTLEQQDARTDRNFDTIADHFEKKSLWWSKGRDSTGCVAS